jgi:hypothetical protein
MSRAVASEHGSHRNAGTIAGFQFLPNALTACCSRLIESHHRVHGYSSLLDILWHEETRAFIAAHEGLQRAFHKASITRRVKKANACYVAVATAILSAEILASGFGGWGQRFPAQRRQAVRLVSKYLPASRTYLTDIYLYQPRGYATATLVTSTSPA